MLKLFQGSNEIILLNILKVAERPKFLNNKLLLVALIVIYGPIPLSMYIELGEKIMIVHMKRVPIEHVFSSTTVIPI